MTRIEEIKARAAKASTAPWKVATAKEFGDHWPITLGNSSIDGQDYHVCTDHVHASEFEGDAKTDAEFIANARQDIPWLLERNAELLEALDGLIKAVERVSLADAAQRGMLDKPPVKEWAVLNDAWKAAIAAMEKP